MQSKKIFGTPISVARRIEAVVNASNQIIISIALERVHIRSQQGELRKQCHVNEDWHKHNTITGPLRQGCGCVYCNALARYVNTKIAAHRLRRRLDDLDWVMQPYDIPQGLAHLRVLESEWPKLREAKNQLKAELGM